MEQTYFKIQFSGKLLENRLVKPNLMKGKSDGFYLARPPVNVSANSQAGATQELA
jgi:hypothetical protein